MSRVFGVNFTFLLGPVFPFIVLGSLISPVVVDALCLALLLLLTAAGIGIWRGERWAANLELVLLSAGGACFTGSGVLLLLFHPAAGILQLAIAVAMGAAAWRLGRFATTRRRFGIALAAAFMSALVVFGAVVIFVLKGLSALR